MRSPPLLLCLALGACGAPSDTKPDEDTDVLLAACGNGALEGDEACDDGDANSDADADACRTDCRLAWCGDGVPDEGEDCDDANAFGGDGCDPSCHVENGALEAEPNDVPFLGTPILPGAAVTGGLREGDVDCYAVTVGENGFLSARVSGPDGECPPDMVLRLYGPDDKSITDAYPGPDGECAAIDPNSEDKARYLHAGTYGVCVEGLFRSAIPAYRVSVEVGDDSCLSGGTTTNPKDDLDGDGLANPCDGDDDGDGVADLADNCPNVSNGGASSGFNTARDGWIRQWLLAGPFTGNAPGPGANCDPSVASLIGDDDAAAVPALGEPAGTQTWRAWISTADAVDFTTVFSASADRESYAAVWVRAPSARDAVLAYGADDGSAAWLDGVSLGADPTCHAVYTDDLEIPVTLTEGWHRVLFKVRDHGGGWGLKARFKTTAGAPMTDLEVSLAADQSWYDDQSDGDGDGAGDVCDATP
jgi:cysteine-rich repeat protein